MWVCSGGNAALALIGAYCCAMATRCESVRRSWDGELAAEYECSEAVMRGQGAVRGRATWSACWCGLAPLDANTRTPVLG
jgi:hypothetical protein